MLIDPDEDVEELHLLPATSTIELRLRGMTMEHRIARSLVVRREVAMPEGPWTPELQQGALDVYSCPRLAAGAYDVYLWIQEGQGEPRAYELMDLELGEGEYQRLELDLDQAELEQEE
jgi:hypothetical protein